MIAKKRKERWYINNDITHKQKAKRPAPLKSSRNNKEPPRFESYSTPTAIANPIMPPELPLPLSPHRLT
jgi:hypothetical protein